jgi:hypothetical protein
MKLSPIVLILSVLAIFAPSLTVSEEISPLNRIRGEGGSFERHLTTGKGRTGKGRTGKGGGKGMTMMKKCPKTTKSPTKPTMMMMMKGKGGKGGSKTCAPTKAPTSPPTNAPTPAGTTSAPVPNP